MTEHQILELKGKDIIKAYNGNLLSKDFEFSCANFNCNYQKRVNMKLFDIYVENTDNISCFVYINNGKIEGRRMFFKGKQLLDDKIFPIITKMDEEIYYLYGYYGSADGDIDMKIIKSILNKYNVIYMDNGAFNNGNYINKKEYWIMKIDNMNYKEFPSIDFLYASPDISSFANFNPSKRIIEWLEHRYNKEDINFHTAYRLKSNDSGINFNKHWNQKFSNDNWKNY